MKLPFEVKAIFRQINTVFICKGSLDVSIMENGNDPRWKICDAGRKGKTYKLVNISQYKHIIIA